jgi:hypothetical protein
LVLLKTSREKLHQEIYKTPIETTSLLDTLEKKRIVAKGESLL